MNSLNWFGTIICAEISVVDISLLNIYAKMPLKCSYWRIQRSLRSKLWSEPSSSSILRLYEQWKLWRVCAYAQTRQRFRCSLMRWIPKYHVLVYSECTICSMRCFIQNIPFVYTVVFVKRFVIVKRNNIGWTGLVRLYSNFILCMCMFDVF